MIDTPPNTLKRVGSPYPNTPQGAYTQGREDENLHRILPTGFQEQRVPYPLER